MTSTIDSVMHPQVLLCNSRKCNIYVDKSKKNVLAQFLCTFLLLQCGDLETNPGPRPLKYPCQICQLACKWGQQSIRCDTCCLWYHKDCMFMTTGEYDSLNKTDASWICCACGTPNFSLSILGGFFDLPQSNSFEPLINSTIDESEIWMGQPAATSSPKYDNVNNNPRRRVL